MTVRKPIVNVNGRPEETPDGDSNNIPFVDDDAPTTPFEGQLWWDTDDTTTGAELAVTDTDTIDLTLLSGTISGDVNTQMSVTSDTSGIKLVNDESSPGNSQLYGTNGSGVKGWYDQPTGGAANTATWEYYYELTGPITSTPADSRGNVWYDCDCTSGSVTLELPLASTVLGKYYAIRKTENSTNQAMLVRSGSDVIDTVGGGSVIAGAGWMARIIFAAEDGKWVNCNKFVTTGSLTLFATGYALVNDDLGAGPGANKVYGTDGSGTRGWQSARAPISITYQSSNYVVAAGITHVIIDTNGPNARLVTMPDTADNLNREITIKRIGNTGGYVRVYPDTSTTDTMDGLSYLEMNDVGEAITFVARAGIWVRFAGKSVQHRIRDLTENTQPVAADLYLAVDGTINGSLYQHNKVHLNNLIYGLTAETAIDTANDALMFYDASEATYLKLKKITPANLTSNKIPWAPTIAYVLFDDSRTVSTADMGTMFYCGASVTFTLPSAATAGDGKFITILQAADISYVDLPVGAVWEDDTSTRTSVQSPTVLTLMSVNSKWARIWSTTTSTGPLSVAQTRRLQALLG
jgi:hypothetical protein